MYTTKGRYLKVNAQNTLNKNEINPQRRVIAFAGGINQ